MTSTFDDHYPFDLDPTITTSAGRRRDGSLVFLREDGDLKFFDEDMNGTQLKYFMLHKFFASLVNSPVLNTTTLQALTTGAINWNYIAAIIGVFDNGIGLCGKIEIETTNAASNIVVSIPNIFGSGQTVTACAAHLATAAGISIQWSITGSGASVIGLNGSDLSSFIQHPGGTLTIRSESADIWQIISREAITERAST